MAEKRKGRSLNAIYCKPLPVTLSVDLYGQLPVTTLANPLSWIWMLYRVGVLYFRTPAQLLDRKYEVDVVDTQPDVVFQIRGQDDMIELWKQGFFGKGTLSRSDPTWRHRAQNQAAQEEFLGKEDVTKARRDERKNFKALRSRAQHYEALARQRQLSPEESENLQQVQKQMEHLKAGQRAAQTARSSTAAKQQTDRPGGTPNEAFDAETLDLESLQLQKTELFFLAFALGVVDVVQEQRQLSLDETFRVCMHSHMHADNPFMLEYIVYHHFRSLGWCVKSGIKFGCNMLLYKRGPPFSHAEYAVMVIANDGREWTTWEDFMAIARVVTGVKKTLVLAYVDMPPADVFSRLTQGTLDRKGVETLLRHFKVTEVVYRRWSPARTRD